MKKVLSLIIIVCILSSAFVVNAASLELFPLQYDAYMRGETIIVQGETNVYVNLGLYKPDDAGVKFFLTYSPEELRDGIEIETGTDEASFPEGTWKIVVQNGDLSETLEFYLTDYVDRTEEDDTPSGDTGSSSKPNGGNTSGGKVSSVTTITPEKTELSLTAGESEKVNITTTASSLRVEVEDEDVISASLSGKILTISAKKRGTSSIWIYANNNYASLKVNVSAAVVPDVTEPTEPETEKETVPVIEDTKKDENPFLDLPDDHWAQKSILSLYEKGVINGMDSTTFAPDSPVTRAQFVTMLYKAFDLKKTASDSPFNDVSSSDWFFDAVMASYENEIAKGGYDGKFNPHSLVTRQDMATFAYRAAKYKGVEFYLTDITTFSDHASISDYAVEAVYAMRSKGVINGMTDTTFEPSGNATRAQAAHIIAKLTELM